MNIVSFIDVKILVDVVINVVTLPSHMLKY